MWTIWCDNISRRSFDEDTFTDAAVKTAEADNFEALRAEAVRAKSGALTGDSNFESVRIFKTRIQPHASDPENSNGGILSVSIPANQWTVCYWLNMLSLLFSKDNDSVHDSINGVVLTRAIAMWHISIWHGAISPEAKEALSLSLRLSSNCSECMATSHILPETRPAFNRKLVPSKKVPSDSWKGWRVNKINPPSRRELSSPIDYDKEMDALLSKYSHKKGSFWSGDWSGDMCSLLGTFTITVLLTGLRMFW